MTDRMDVGKALEEGIVGIELACYDRCCSAPDCDHPAAAAELRRLKESGLVEAVLSHMTWCEDEGHCEHIGVAFRRYQADAGKE